MNGIRRAAAMWVTLFWIFLTFCFLSVLSLALSLFSFGVVLNLQWSAWTVFYWYMVAFPLLGIGIMLYFLMVYVKKAENASKATLFIVSIPYILILTAIFAYLIYDAIVNCSQNNDIYCWNGLAIRWQYWWMFFSIGFQWLFVILQIIFTNQVINAYQTERILELVEPTEKAPLRETTTTSQKSSPQSKVDLSNVQVFPNPIGMLLLHSVHGKTQ
jgi:hypothetical protein